MKVRSNIATPLIAVLVITALLSVPACSKDTIAALVNTLGNAAASVAALEGNSVLADALTRDTAAAVRAINGWEKGSPAQEAIQALNLVVADLNLFPQTAPYQPLIVLAVTTAEAIIAILSPSSNRERRMAEAKFSDAPKNAAQFRSRWNAIALSNAAMSKAVIK